MKNNIVFEPPGPLDTAVLFLVFNRLDTTKQVFESIRQAKPPRLYIAADGARPSKNGEAGKVNAVREYVISNVDWDCKVETLFRDENLGCKYAVSSAITWFFKSEEQGIILEDDCLPNQSFFWFCEELLERYKDDYRVWHIGGTNPIEREKLCSDEYYYSIYNRIWGWASWRRAWDKYDPEICEWPEIKRQRLLESFLNKKQVGMFNEIFDDLYDKKIDTWDYQWFLIRLLNGTSITPKVNLISNIGFGVEATHTFNEEDELSGLPTGEMFFPLKHPDFFVHDRARDTAWAAIQTRGETFFSKIKRVFNK